MCHGKLPIPITAYLFATLRSVARASSPSYTDSTLPAMWFMALLAQNDVLQTLLVGGTVNYITMEYLVGGECMSIDLYTMSLLDNLA